MPIRFVLPEDAETLSSIYAPYVANTAISFEYQPPGAESFAQRIETIRRQFPYIVYHTCDGQLLGYAYAGRLRQRQAYDWDVELSVYVDSSARRSGIGSALYSCLLDLLTWQGVRWAYGVVTLPNPASDALHRRLGFQLVARFPEMGYKMGKWWDIGWYLKELSTPSGPPQPVLPIQQDHPQVQEILSRYQAL